MSMVSSTESFYIVSVLYETDRAIKRKEGYLIVDAGVRHPDHVYNVIREKVSKYPGFKHFLEIHPEGIYDYHGKKEQKAREQAANHWDHPAPEEPIEVLVTFSGGCLEKIYATYPGGVKVTVVELDPADHDDTSILAEHESPDKITVKQIDTQIKKAEAKDAKRNSVEE